LQGALASRRKLPARQRVGMCGEKEAIRHLKKSGYTILERNFRVPAGEVDIIAFRDGVLAFVEVRTRSVPAHPDPLESIGKRKQRRVIKAARAYAKHYRLEREDIALRFDVATVLLDAAGKATRIKHIPSAFEI